MCPAEPSEVPDVVTLVNGQGAPAAARGTEYQRHGLSHTAGLAARCSSADMNCRWLTIRSRSARGVARLRRIPARRGRPAPGSPAGRSMPASGSLIGSVGHTGDAAERVDQPGEPAESDLGVVVEAQPGGLLHGLGEQRRPADRERGVDFVLAVARGSVRRSRAVSTPPSSACWTPAPARWISRMVSVRPLPMSPPVARSCCCSADRPWRLSEPDEQPVGAAPGCRPVGVVRQAPPRGAGTVSSQTAPPRMPTPASNRTISR